MHQPNPFPFGRSLVALLSLGLMAAAVSVLTAAEVSTPRTGRGPFFPVDDAAGLDNDLTVVEGTEARPQGDVLYIDGVVKDGAGRALPGATVIIWQTDVWAKYDHPREDRTDAEGDPLPLDPGFQYAGRTVTDEAGHYTFKTILPGQYGVSGRMRPRHVHFEIRHPDHRPLATEMQIDGDPHADEDFVTNRRQRTLLAVPLADADAEPGAQRAVFDIILGS